MRTTSRRSGARTLTLAAGALLACSSCLVTPVVAAPPASLVLGNCKDKNENNGQGRICEVQNPPGFLVEQDAIEIQLEDGSKVKFNKKQLPAQSNGNAWFGEDENGSERAMNIVTRKGFTAASFVTGDIIHQMATVEDGSLQVVSTPVSEFPDEGHVEDMNIEEGFEPIIEDLEFGNDRRLSSQAKTPKIPATISNSLFRGAKMQRRNLADDSGSVLDVMVLWTRRAECRRFTGSTSCTLSESSRASMEALVDLAVAETNSAYSLSGINTQLRLVHMYRNEDYVEVSGDAYGHALDTIRAKNDGILDEVHLKRDFYGADIVAILIDDSQSCGLGYIGPSETSMFSVTGKQVYKMALAVYLGIHLIAFIFTRMSLLLH